MPQLSPSESSVHSLRGYCRLLPGRHQEAHPDVSPPSLLLQWQPLPLCLLGPLRAAGPLCRLHRLAPHSRSGLQFHSFLASWSHWWLLAPNLAARRAGGIQAGSPLSCGNWGLPSHKAFDEFPSHSPPGKSKGVRFMAAPGGFLSHQLNLLSHKSQTVGWLYGKPCFWPPLGGTQTSGSPVPSSPTH